ncbi:retropepsin-like aspartic protease family protein [Neomegalonema perideroedes]|uniref:retropepsin-like aspartic protease family protein n=1 Tax=Neomegalonema perideroedes TaxID=217219 RepID=UPI00037F8EF6|nr:TIGR02281 family clan AA aspartic protease [Neomegalonema perideroedes]
MTANRVFLLVIFGLVLFWLSRRDPAVLSNPDNIVRMVALLGFLGLFVFAWGRNRRSRGEGGRSTALMALIWVGIFGALMLGYNLVTGSRAARDAAEFARISGMEDPGSGARQVTLIKERDGHFHVEARVNGMPLRMMVDTGATSVAIPYEDAEALGISTSRLAYVIDIRTANGVTKAAPVVLESLTLGPISMRDLRATVAQPGALETPLLGQSVLNRLQGYHVQGDRMILTGR